MDPTGAGIAGELEAALDPDSIAREPAAGSVPPRRGWVSPEAVRGRAADALPASPWTKPPDRPVEVRLTALAAGMDVEAAKAWLTAEREGAAAARR